MKAIKLYFLYIYLKQDDNSENDYLTFNEYDKFYIRFNQLF